MLLYLLLFREGSEAENVEDDSLRNEITGFGQHSPATDPSATRLRCPETLVRNLQHCNIWVYPYVVCHCPLLLNISFVFLYLNFFSLPPFILNISPSYLYVYMFIYIHISTWDFHGIAKWKATIMPVLENFLIFKIVNNVVSPFRIGLSSH